MAQRTAQLVTHKISPRKISQGLVRWWQGDRRDPAIEPQLQALRWRLLGSFLLVMSSILGLGVAATAQFFSYTLQRQLDSQLFVLAQAAAHSFEEIREAHHERSESAGEPEHLDNDFFEQHEELQPRLDNDGDLDLPWQRLQQPKQGVEWYSVQGKLLARQGSIFPAWPLRQPRNVAGETSNGDRLRVLTVSVYDHDHPKTGQPLGFVRVAESIDPLTQFLHELLWGMGAGTLLSLVLSGLGGLWLTRQSLGPIAQSFRQLRQFTADASHELRGPLSALRTSIEVMQDHPERFAPIDRRKLTTMASSVEQMSRLVEDLLLLARSDSAQGSVAHDRVRLDLEELLEGLLETYGDRAAAADLHLEGDLQPGVTVWGDPALLWRLFGNLLENALQYTPPGGKITVRLWAVTARGAGRNLPESHRPGCHIRITDTGMGIAPEDVPHLFDRLWRADQARQHCQGGAGLGLAIAQAIVVAHQGEITVTSAIGQGSCFQVWLPDGIKPGRKATS